jgi:hypothetical protein
MGNIGGFDRLSPSLHSLTNAHHQRQVKESEEISFQFIVIQFK